jgi:hypothetical protein
MRSLFGGLLLLVAASTPALGLAVPALVAGLLMVATDE